MEEELMNKFVVVLNAKKKKLREIKRTLIEI